MWYMVYYDMKIYTVYVHTEYMYDVHVCIEREVFLYFHEAQVAGLAIYTIKNVYHMCMSSSVVAYVLS